MKKRDTFKYILAFVTAVMIFGIIIAAMTSCNKQLIDTSYTFKIGRASCRERVSGSV